MKMSLKRYFVAIYCGHSVLGVFLLIYFDNYKVSVWPVMKDVWIMLYVKKIIHL